MRPAEVREVVARLEVASAEKRRLMEEVERLREQVRRMEEARKEEGLEKEKFYEGASWLAQ